jgi:STE24 endopeptidase
VAAAVALLVMAIACFWPLRGASQAAVSASPPGAAEHQPTAGQSAYQLPPDKLAKAITLSRIRNVMDIVGQLWGLAVLWVLLAARGAAALQSWAERVFRRRWQQGLLFFVALIAILTLLSLPIDVFGHIVSRSYGISVQGWGSWFWDQAKSLALSVAAGAPVLLLLNWVACNRMHRWPRNYWLAAWLVTLPLLALSAVIEPLAEPLFNDYEPLSRGHAALVARLDEVAARTGTAIPHDHMFLMKASEKSTGLNAYVSGIGPTKRIVVWDTTADSIPDDEIMFVFAHECGHYVLNHIPKGLAISAIGLFFIYWACAGFGAALAKRFGARWGLSAAAPLASRAGFVVLIFAVSVAAFVLEPVSNTISRFFEHEADVYGQEAMHGLVPDPQKTAVAGFNALGEAWLEDPDPSPFIEFWEYNHPSVKTRANFAAHYDPWANGGRGRFFEK